jgi:hypothetical protein
VTGRLVLRGLRDLRPPAYPVMPAGGGCYPLDLRPAFGSLRPDGTGVVAVPGPDGRLYHNPVSVSLYALARHTDEARAGFLTQAEYLRASQDGDGGWRYPMPVRRYQVPPGWYSAMAQGLAISVLLRSYDICGERSYLDAAGAAAGLMLRPVADGGCAHYDKAGRPFLEECPGDPPSHILNGALFALIGLAEYEARVSGTACAAVAGRLAGQLGGYDLGYWSRYDLRFDAPASLAYHCLHISLLEAAGRLLGQDAFRQAAAGWRGYLRRPGCRVRAAGRKAWFVLRE